MKRNAIVLLLAVVALGAAGRVQAQKKPEIAKTNLKVGQAAPDFALLDNHWNTVRLNNYRGKKSVILAFYVLAFTSG